MTATALPLTPTDLRTFLLIQSLALQVTAARKALVSVEYSGRNNLIQFGADHIESQPDTPFDERLYPPVILCLGVEDGERVSSALDRFASFLITLVYTH